jgi:hypothetical protein
MVAHGEGVENRSQKAVVLHLRTKGNHGIHNREGETFNHVYVAGAVFTCMYLHEVRQNIISSF